MTYCRFLDDPEQIAALNGQRYVVLRPRRALADAYREVRRAFAARVGHRVSHPAEPHVTLAGFGEDASVALVRDVVGEWARTAPPLRLDVERVSVFPSPFQIVVVEIRKTEALLDALSTIRRRAGKAGLHDLAPVPPHEWIFHMSVAYCAALTASAWAEVVDAVESIPVAQATEVVEAVEVVAFDDNQEYSGGVMTLSGTRRRNVSA